MSLCVLGLVVYIFLDNGVFCSKRTSRVGVDVNFNELHALLVHICYDWHINRGYSDPFK